MKRHFFLLTFILAVCLISPAYALNTPLKITINPLECTTDTIDDGINVYRLIHTPNCKHDIPEHGHSDQTKEQPTVATIASSTEDTQQTSYMHSPELSNSSTVSYHIKLPFVGSRQSVLHTVVVSLGAMSTLSLAAFLIRLFIP